MKAHFTFLWHNKIGATANHDAHSFDWSLPILSC